MVAPLRNDRLQEVSIHSSDIGKRDFFRANGLTLALVRTIPEAFRVHLLDHPNDTASAFGFALGQESEVRDLR